MVPAELDTAMDFIIEGLEDEEWDLTFDQFTKAKVYGVKGTRQVITIHGYESDQYSGYESEIIIEWIPKSRIG